MTPPLDGINDLPTISTRRARWLVACAAALFGTVTVGGSFLYRTGFSLYEISLYPLILTCLMLFPAFLRQKYAIRKQMLPFFVVYGLIGALVQLSQFGGVILGVPIATVSLFLYTQPIWTSLLGKLLLGETLNLRKLLAVALGILGSFVLIQEGSDAPANIRGILSAILGGLFLALWVIWGRKCGLQNYHYITTTAGWSAFSSVWLALLWPLFSLVIHNDKITRLSLNFPIRHWLLLAAFALIAGLIPSLLTFRGLQTVSASTAGIILLLEPLSAGTMAALLFHQPLGLHIFVAAALILLSNLLFLWEA